MVRLPLATVFFGLYGGEWARLVLGLLALIAVTGVVVAVVCFLTRDRPGRG